jgi:hypothetical protein
VKRDSTPGSYPSSVGLLGIFDESVKTTFDDHADFMPNGRTKYIHSVGVVGKVKFIPDSNTPYTGIFGSGSQYGLIRMSSAATPTSTTLTPGFGIKFFRTGRESANFMSMPSLDGQSDFNFFKNEFTNNPGFPSGFALKLVAQKFWQASRCPLRVGLGDTATYSETGAQTRTPNFPWRIIFKPTGSITFPSAPYSLSKLNSLFAGVANGTTLFEVFANDSPSDMINGDKRVRLGVLKLASEFVTSDYGDNKLFFKHHYSEFDFAAKGSWLSQIAGNEKNICGMEGITPTPPS